MKLKELLASLGGLVLSDADLVSVVSLLRDKSPTALDSWYKVRHKSVYQHILYTWHRRSIVLLHHVDVVVFNHQTATKFEPSAQQLAEKERLLTTIQEEASIAKDKVKQLSQVRCSCLSLWLLYFIII